MIGGIAMPCVGTLLRRISGGWACRELQVNGRPVGSTGAISAQEGGELNIEGGVKPARCLILPFLVLHEIAFINVGVWASKCQKQRFATYIQSTNLRFIGRL